MRRLRRGEKKDWGRPVIRRLDPRQQDQKPFLHPPPTVFFPNRYRRRKWMGSAEVPILGASPPRLGYHRRRRRSTLNKRGLVCRSRMRVAEGGKEGYNRGEGEEAIFGYVRQRGEGGPGRKPAAPTGEKKARVPTTHGWLGGWSSPLVWRDGREVSCGWKDV